MKISIIGATGNVGSCAAFSIAVSGFADEMVLIDNPRPDLRALHSLDINTAVTGRDMLVRGGDYADMADSDIVIVAAGSAQTLKSRLEVLPPNLPIIQDISKKVVQYCKDAIIITASNPVCPLNYGMYRCSGLDRKKIIGYTYNDSIRFRQRLADALGVPSSRVEGAVIGEHGDSQVLLFSSVKVDGKPVAITEDMKRMLRQQVPARQKQLEDLNKKTGRTAAWTTAAGLTAVCRAITEDKGAMIPCSVTLDGEYGCHNLSMAVPMTLGRGGVKQILEWNIAPDEQALLNQSIEVLRPYMKYVEELLHLCRA
jgi:malate dehydrogenase